MTERLCSPPTLVLLLALVAAPVSHAQNEAPVPDPVIADAEGLESVPEELSAEGDVDPEEERQRQIDQNYRETIGIYRGVLENEGAELANLDLRIAANEKMLAEYRTQRREAEDERRQLNVGFDRQVLELREAAQRGEIAAELLDRLLDEKRQARQLRDEELHSDIVFYSQEIDRLGGIARELKSRHQILSLTHRYSSSAAPQEERPSTPPSVIDQLQTKYRRVSGFESRSVMHDAPRIEPWATQLRGGPANEPRR